MRRRVRWRVLLLAGVTAASGFGAWRAFTSPGVREVSVRGTASSPPPTPAPSPSPPPTPSVPSATPPPPPRVSRTGQAPPRLARPAATPRTNVPRTKVPRRPPPDYPDVPGSGALRTLCRGTDCPAQP